MHAPITMRAMQQGLHVYTQKPLTQAIYEARQLARVAAEKKLVSQMGIQIHSHDVHRTVVATIQAGAIGKVKEVHSWSGKHWGDRNPRPNRMDKVPETLNWNFWLGVAAERPFIKGYYHPGEWRKRLDFGTGTFGDMGCHILDPVFTSLALP
jgi:predicted dehydrogenase